MMEFMDIEKSGAVAVMTWHHEEQNRFNTPFLKEILQVLDDLERDGSVSSVVVKSSVLPVNDTFTYVIFNVGLTRPGAPGPSVCGPVTCIGIDNENVAPRRTHAAARFTAAASMRFSVPRSSSSPHRPQFETRAASAFSSSGSTSRRTALGARA